MLIAVLSVTVANWKKKSQNLPMGECTKLWYTHASERILTNQKEQTMDACHNLDESHK